GAEPHLFNRHSGANDDQGGPGAARESQVRRAGIDRIEADVETERDVRLGEPARATAVVDRLQIFLVGETRLLADGLEEPDRLPDATADVAPAVAVAEVER